MPTYEYACRDCAEHIEVVQSFRDDALQVCPNCGGRLRKVFAAAGIIFKGSGYYVTDSRKPATTGASESGAKEGGGDGEKDRKKESASSTSTAESGSSAKKDASKSGSAKAESA